ncbi:hypothetical protein [Clostridium sardiniense]|uniref:hypothetical protein n=1 Tax=Clostridium sardiniense TaxID=29369 RepID=UPI003D34FA7D
MRKGLKGALWTIIILYILLIIYGWVPARLSKPIDLDSDIISVDIKTLAENTDQRSCINSEADKEKIMKISNNKYSKEELYYINLKGNMPYYYVDDPAILPQEYTACGKIINAEGSTHPTLDVAYTDVKLERVFVKGELGDNLLGFSIVLFPVAVICVIALSSIYITDYKNKNFKV